LLIPTYTPHTAAYTPGASTRYVQSINSDNISNCNNSREKKRKRDFYSVPSIASKRDN